MPRPMNMLHVTLEAAQDFIAHDLIVARKFNNHNAKELRYNPATHSWSAWNHNRCIERSTQPYPVIQAYNEAVA